MSPLHRALRHPPRGFVSPPTGWAEAVGGRHLYDVSLDTGLVRASEAARGSRACRRGLDAVSGAATGNGSWGTWGSSCPCPHFTDRRAEAGQRSFLCGTPRVGPLSERRMIHSGYCCLPRARSHSRHVAIVARVVLAKLREVVTSVSGPLAAPRLELRSPAAPSGGVTPSVMNSYHHPQRHSDSRTNNDSSPRLLSAYCAPPACATYHDAKLVTHVAGEAPRLHNPALKIAGLLGKGWGQGHAKASGTLSPAHNSETIKSPVSQDAFEGPCVLL